MAAIPKCVSANAALSRVAATRCSARPPIPAGSARSSHPNQGAPRSRLPLISPPALSSPRLSSEMQCRTSLLAPLPPLSRRNSIFQTRAQKLFRDCQLQASLPETPCLQRLSRSHRKQVLVALRRAHPFPATPSQSPPSDSHQESSPAISRAREFLRTAPAPPKSARHR